jgi:hypothetical protein
MKTTLAFFLVIRCAMAQVPFDSQSNDPHICPLGKLNGGLITSYSTFTPPPVLIGDVTYGVSKRLSLGVMGGTQGSLALLGPKLNLVLAQPSNHFRWLFRFVSIYYFERDGKFLLDRTYKQVMPWILSMAVMDAEWRTQKGIRWSIGMGLMETHCVDGMMALLQGKSRDDDEKEEDLPFELFNTIHGSVSVPLSRRLTFRLETIVVMRGFQLIQPGVFKVASPVNPFINLSYSFNKNR